MNSRDLIMVLSSLLSMAAGVFLPQAAEPLAAMPRLILIFMLYMSFLAVGMEALMREIRHMKGTLCFLVALRLAVLPLLYVAFSALGYYMGTRRISVMSKLVYKDEKKKPGSRKRPF